MKLWSEGWIVNAGEASPLERVAASATAAATTSTRNGLAAERRRADSLAKDFEKRR